MSDWLRSIGRLAPLLAALFALMWVPAARAEATDAGAHEILVMLRLAPDHLRPNASYGGDYGDQTARSARHRVAKRIARRYGLDLVEDGWPMPLVGVDCYVMRVPKEESVDAKIALVSRDPQIAWSQPVQVYRAQGGQERTGDPLFAVQPAAKTWRLADLHRVAKGRGVVVAVVDSKIELNHPDLSGQFVTDQDFVRDHPSGAERHGTGVAGVIAAKEGNGVGIAGIAPAARLMALRACWQTGGAPSDPTVCDTLSLAKALHFAIQNDADIINLSLAGPPDRLLGRLVDVALTRRISVVAAFDPSLPKGGFPASEAGVVAVADDALPPFPPGVFAAPGRDVPTTQPGGTWYLVNGSSYSAAHVSGLIALVRGDHAAFRRAMLVTAHSTGGPIDACATVLRASKPCNCTCPTPAQTSDSDR